jgi:hypothetical protein
MVVLVVSSAAIAPAAAHPGPGALIVFEENREIYVMDSVGGNLVNLSRYVGHDGHPLWSPDGTRLAFTSTRNRVSGAAGVDIYVVELKSGDIYRVTWDSSGGPPSSWSPDGGSIVYVSGQDGEIYRVDVATGNKVRLTTKGDDPFPPPPTVSFDTPSFSPDGSRIAYTERSWNVDRVSGAIFVMDADGTNPTRLTSSPTPEGSLLKWTDNDQFPAWSPDGSQIVFSSDQDGADQHDLDLYVMNADGSGRRRITTESGFVGHPAWSPNGARVAYSGRSYSFATDADGANRIALGDVVASRPNWSADGARIALSSVLGMAIVNADGSNFTVVVPQGLKEEPVLAFPAWQPVYPPVGLVDPATGRWHLRAWGNAKTFYYGNPGDYPILGDWDCDGTATPGLYRQTDGYVYLRNSNTQGVADVRFFFGNPGDIPIAGDFDGDGCDTVSIYRPSEGRVFMHNQLGSQGETLGPAQLSYYFGNPGDKPFVGDFDGDGVDTVGLHRESTGLVYFRNSHTQGIADASFFFGNPGDRFVAGDWTQDGIDTPGLFRPADTKLFFRNANTHGNADAALVWGNADWLPVAGRFDLN